LRETVKEDTTMLFRLPVSWLALAWVSLNASASTIQRCEDANAQITFTYQGCTGDEKATSLQRSSPMPGAKTTPSPPYKPVDKPSRSVRNNAIVVVGQRDDGCSNRLGPESRRRAIINQQTPPGMTRRDVESLLGRPDKVINKNGETQLVYKEKKGRINRITLDLQGCVKGKR
jgi:hypothetical protein